jgi:hypothetical protein
MDKNEQEDQGPEEVASEDSGTGGADSPEEVIGVDPDVAQSEKDPDAGPTKTAEQVEQDSDRDQAEG